MRRRKKPLARTAAVRFTMRNLGMPVAPGNAEVPLNEKPSKGLGKYPLQRLAGALIQQEFERRKARKKPPGAARYESNNIRTARRKPLRKKGLRAARSASALQAFREALHVRAKYACELCNARGSPTWPITLDPHHLVSRARAPGWPDLHNPEVNGMALCRSCHSKATLDPSICGTRYLLAWAAHRDWVLSPQRFKP